MKQCPGCRIEKPHSDFYPDASKRLKIGSYCKECSRVKAGVAHEHRKLTVKVIPKKKRCLRCGVVREADAFWRQGAARDGLMPECKACRKDRGRKVRYGMASGDYDRLMEQQNGACASCSSTEDTLVVDHCHEDGRVRGLLCRACNTAIGIMGETPERLIAAAGYLIRTAREIE